MLFHLPYYKLMETVQTANLSYAEPDDQDLKSVCDITTLAQSRLHSCLQMSQIKRSQKKKQKQTQSDGDLNCDARTVTRSASVYDAVAGTTWMPNNLLYSGTDMAEQDALEVVA